MVLGSRAFLDAKENREVNAMSKRAKKSGSKSKKRKKAVAGSYESPSYKRSKAKKKGGSRASKLRKGIAKARSGKRSKKAKRLVRRKPTAFQNFLMNKPDEARKKFFSKSDLK